MPPSKTHLDSPYTPQQMKKVLEDALSPANMPNSPLAYKTPTPTKDFESGYCSETSSEYDEDVTYSKSPARFHAYGDAETGLRATSTENTSLLTLHPPRTPVLGPLSTPVRPLDTPSPSRDKHALPARSFEVEAPFLQAMVGLLERQANILPEHVLTKSDIRRIVRKEIDKDKKELGIERTESMTMSNSFRSRHVVGMVVGVAGWVVVQRAFVRHPEEMVWYLDGAWKGGLVGLAGGFVVKMVLWGLDYLRRE
jgi:hypothetical protein